MLRLASDADVHGEIIRGLRHRLPGIDLAGLLQVLSDKNGPEIFKRVEGKQRLLAPAWLTHVGRKRPNTPKGLPIEEDRSIPPPSTRRFAISASRPNTTSPLARSGSDQTMRQNASALRRLAVAITFLFAAIATIAAAKSRAAAQDIDMYRMHLLPESDRPGRPGAVKVTFLGTTTLLFDDGETQLMIDGFFSRPTLLEVVAGKIKTDTKAVDNAVKRARIDRLKALFVAHSHYDHAFDVAYVIQQTGAKLYGSASTLNIGRGGDLREEQMALYEPGKEVPVGRFAVTVLKSKHSPPKAGINDDLGMPIEKPLRQPARFRDYKEGGSFDFLIRYGGRTVLVIPSSNYIEGALDEVRADVLFLGTGSFGLQTPKFKNAYYAHTVGKVRPKLVIPIHWDNFFKPLSDKLQAPGPPADDLSAGFDFLIERLAADKITFGILQGYQSVLLFNDPPPCPEFRPVVLLREPRRRFRFGFNRFHRR